MLAKVVKTIPIVHHSLNNSDINKLVFPVMVEKILDIRKVNEEAKIELTMEDHSFTFAVNKYCDKNDKIAITFIKKSINIEIVLEISDIYKYSCSLNRGNNKDFEGTRIDIMDIHNGLFNQYNAKYDVLTSVDLFSILANKVVIKEARYI